jgi:4-amino-4-deoxy-L-arabinose transferase-like glycosyltransferase
MSALLAPPARVVEPTAPLPRPPALHVPLFLVVLASASWALTLDNAIFIDESVYIMGGRAYIDHWLNGTELPADLGAGFSGHPVLYPVLAGALDMVGGLALVRIFSLVCMIATMFLLRSIAMHLFTRRSGLVTAAMFGLTGPVMYVGHLGTFDALVILMLATALWLGLTRDRMEVVLLIAPLLALAVATKYTAYVFVPAILVLITFTRSGLAHSTPLREWRPRPSWERVGRSLLAGLLVGCTLVVLYVASSEKTRESLAFTTTSREALSPAPRDYLVGLLPAFAWPIFFAAGMGLVFLAFSRRWTAVVFALGLIGTAMLLPIGQVILGEAVSFQKHLAYSAVFLAPLAGYGFARPWRMAIWTPVLVWWLILTTMWGMFRSHDLIQYPDVRPVVEVLDFDKGTYLSSSANSLTYYTRQEPDIRWEPTFNLYAAGDAAIEQAVRTQKYEVIVISAGPTGSTIQDAGQRVLLDALDDSRYTRDVTGEEDQWLVYSAP